MASTKTPSREERAVKREEYEKYIIQQSIEKYERCERLTKTKTLFSSMGRIIIRYRIILGKQCNFSRIFYGTDGTVIELEPKTDKSPKEQFAEVKDKVKDKVKDMLLVE